MYANYVREVTDQNAYANTTSSHSRLKWTVWIESLHKVVWIELAVEIYGEEQIQRDKRKVNTVFWKHTAKHMFEAKWTHCINEGEKVLLIKEDDTKGNILLWIIFSICQSMWVMNEHKITVSLPSGVRIKPEIYFQKIH